MGGDYSTAESELAQSNAQSELSALVRGMHALQATEKGSKIGKSVAAYAEAVGWNKMSVSREVWAAEVAAQSNIDVTLLQDLSTHLSEIHAAPAAALRRLVRCFPPGNADQTVTSQIRNTNKP